jgi:predicted O-methyltransferase YrrM
MMTARLNAGMLHELYQRKEAFPLDAALLSRITPSTLSAETLQFLGMLVLWKQPCHIFEFGSGLSTLFLSRLQQELGVGSHPSVMSIDHSQRYLGETRRALGPAPDVFLLHAPLAVTECGGRVFTTYHPDYTHQIPPGIHFDLVLIDGPPAYRYGREAPLYHLAPYLSPNALIILDDANREPEQEALRNWQATWPEAFVVEMFPELKKGLAVLSIGDTTRAMHHPAHETQISADLDRVIRFLKAERGVLADGR